MINNKQYDWADHSSHHDDFFVWTGGFPMRYTGTILLIKRVKEISMCLRIVRTEFFLNVVRSLSSSTIRVFLDGKSYCLIYFYCNVLALIYIFYLTIVGLLYYLSLSTNWFQRLSVYNSSSVFLSIAVFVFTYCWYRTEKNVSFLYLFCY